MMRFSGMKTLRHRLLRFCVSNAGEPRPIHAAKKSTFLSTHDYIICGAGSAGCVLVNRVSSDSNNKVLLIEGGSTDEDVTDIRMPAGFQTLLSGRYHNWYYNTAPQKHLNNRNLYCPRGKVMGGSSSINAMIYIRGHPLDYDRWENEGAQGWSYADCLPYFKKLETHDQGANEYHGENGPVPLTKMNINSNPLFKAFVDAGLQAGYSYTDDMNGLKQEGFGPFYNNISNGVRYSSSYAYIKPIEEQRKERLQVETKALVTKVLFEGKKAVGVEYLQNNELKRARARKEVIISGGSINSPQLLMLSGIGDGDELKKHGISVVSHLPGVGKNLQDHLGSYIHQACRKPVTLWSENLELTYLENKIEWVRSKTGPGTTCATHAGAFVKSTNDIPHPDIQLIFVPCPSDPQGLSKEVQRHCYMVIAYPLRSQSKGTIKLRSADPRYHPLIDFNYMSTDQDWVEMRAAIKITRNVLQQKAFDEYRGEDIYPGANIQTDDEIDHFIRQSAESIYHPASSCKMGDSSDKMTVVDNETRVLGVDGLRVVDASIMPSLISGNTNVPTMMIAEKASDHILGNTILPKCHVPFV